MLRVARFRVKKCSKVLSAGKKNTVNIFSDDFLIRCPPPLSDSCPIRRFARKIREHVSKSTTYRRSRRDRENARALVSKRREKKQRVPKTPKPFDPTTGLASRRIATRPQTADCRRSIRVVRIRFGGQPCVRR